MFGLRGIGTCSERGVLEAMNQISDVRGYRNDIVSDRTPLLPSRWSEPVITHVVRSTEYLS